MKKSEKKKKTKRNLFSVCRRVAQKFANDRQMYLDVCFVRIGLADFLQLYASHCAWIIYRPRSNAEVK